MSAFTANGIAEAVTGGQGNPTSAQLAMITAGTTLLSGGIAAALGQNAQGAVNAAANETLNNTCGSENPHGCGYKLAAAGATAGGAVTAIGSVGVDVATGGLNVLATPAEVAGGSALGGALGGAFGSALDWLSAHGGAIFNSGDEVDAASAGEAATGGDASADNTNPYSGPVDQPVVVVDKNGNAIPVNEGEQVKGSPNGDYQQVLGPDGKPTGVRLDRGGHPNQRDPAAQGPHGHVPGVTTPDGNPHLPINH